MQVAEFSRSHHVTLERVHIQLIITQAAELSRSHNVALERFCVQQWLINWWSITTYYVTFICRNRSLRVSIISTRILVSQELYHYNLAHSIVWKISKRQPLQYWADRNPNNMADSEWMDLTSFKWAHDKTTFHMEHFIKKCMSNNLSTMAILQQQGHAATNLCHGCGLVPEMIQHMYQCTHKGSRTAWKNWYRLIKTA